MSEKIYDFGVDLIDTTAETRKLLIWPVSVWSCYIPENLNRKIDILEKLVLSLVKLEIRDYKSILTVQLGFDIELVNAVIKKCEEDQLLHKTNHKILKAGLEALAEYENPFESDIEIAKNNKKVYLIQDLVTSEVIPCFDLEILPTFYEEVEDFVKVSYNSDNEKRRPRITSINNALKHWKKIRNIVDKGDYLPTKNLTVEILGNEEDDEISIFNDEVDWRKIDDNGDIKENNIIIKDEMEKNHQYLPSSLYSNVTIYDEKPEKYYIKSYIALNSNNPDELMILSPLGSNLGYWFRTIFNRVYTNNADFKLSVDIFIEEKKKYLMDKYPFNNSLDIELFKKFPLLCNHEKYKDMKTCIENVVRAKNRIENGEAEFYSYGTSIRTSVDRIFKEVIKTINKLDLIKNRIADFSDYRKAIKDLVFTYNLDNEIERRYCNSDIHRNICRSSGNAKDNAAILLLEASFYKDSRSMMLLKNMPELFLNIFSFAGEGNDFIHANDGFSDKKYSREEIEQSFLLLNNMITALYTHYLRGE